MIVNSIKEDSSNKTDAFKNLTSVPVYQDNTQARVWEMYKAETFDVVIFDKCNRVVFHLSLPESVVQKGFIKESLIAAYTKKQCSQSCDRMLAKCEGAPWWGKKGPQKGVAFPEVTVLAFLKASCGFCRRQSTK